MSLKEKFTKILYTQSHDDAHCLRIRFENIDKVIDSQEKIADEFAIEFANWALNNRERIWRIPPITDEQVLEIFKKEKGL
jgi:hypothetical protein